jgi:hypothetical protein
MALKDLKAKYQTGRYDDHIQKKSESHPRDTVVRTLNQSLQLFEDPGFRIRRKGKKGSPATETAPYACFKQNASGSYVVWVAYARKRLNLDGEDCFIVPKSVVAELHRSLIDEVNSGTFDAQINKLAEGFRQTLTKSGKKAAA